MRRSILPVVSAISLSAAGGILGSWYERSKQNATNSLTSKRTNDDLPNSRWTLFTHAEATKKDSPSQPPSQNRSGEIMKFGFPDHGQVQMHDNYVISYDRRMRNAKWVFECLTRDEVKYNDAIDRTDCQFEVDQSVHPFFQSTNEDYRGSGYDRGHLAAAANHRRSGGVMQKTFLLSNVGEGFNRGIWNNLEKYVRSLTKLYSKVYVCTGPLYLAHQETNRRRYVKYEVIGTNSVAVPTHFFKVVLGETKDQIYDLRAFIIPNTAMSDDTPLEKFLVPIDAIERAAGILVFERLPRNQLRSVNAPL
ncbi:endonuclease G, mitochondrial-like isoform X2 [Acanthaster planci]|uniref:Endonuclease n=1 Tax=Acanthaster planci TaxID=133434 RepID=A0A8B7YBA1_ACAPL|nr:endonuclease G, mitochondrial-like isoform X2 [Acanthaster planci]